MSSHGKEVLNNAGFPLFYQKVSPSNVPKMTEKYFYDEEGELKYLFEYKANGDLYQLVIFSAEKIIEVPPGNIIYHTEFSWTGLDYYLQATPHVPIK